MTRGVLLAGRYALDERLGVGNASESWRATDETTGRTVAVELLAPAGPPAPDPLLRLSAEVDASRSLRHRCLVPVLAAGREGDVVFAVRAFAPGEPLDALLAEGPLPAEAARTLALDLCRLLAWARRAGAPHRGLVPRHVIVAPGGAPRVVGFLVPVAGRPIALDEQRFLPPEQHTEVVQTEAEEVYNVGALLAEACRGSDEPEAAQLLDVARVATSADPDARYRSLADLVAAVRAGPEAVRERRRVRPAIALVAVGLALAVLAAWFTGPSVAVPSVVGMPPQRAAAAVRAAGLLPRVLPGSGSPVAEQRPGAGTRVRPRSVVVLLR